MPFTSALPGVWIMTQSPFLEIRKAFSPSEPPRERVIPTAFSRRSSAYELRNQRLISTSNTQASTMELIKEIIIPGTNQYSPFSLLIKIMIYNRDGPAKLY
jgi:hypothetical protein